MISCDLPRAIRLAMIRGCFSRCLRDFRPDLFSTAGRLVHFHRFPADSDSFLVPSLIYRRNKVPFIDYLRCAPSPSDPNDKDFRQKISPLPILFRFLKRPLFVLRMLFILSDTNRFDEIVLSSAICTFYYEGKKKKKKKKKRSKKENIPLEFLFDRNVYYLHV